MLSSYLKLALGHLQKNRLYALINITGLTLGLTVFLFSTLLVNYETNHDHMFAKRDRTFIVSSVYSQASEENLAELPNVHSAYGPLFIDNIDALEQVCRTIFKQRLVSNGKTSELFGIRFVDPGFTDIFDFNYLEGDKNVLDDANAVIITASTAQKLFGQQRVVGKTLTVSLEHQFTIAAVIEDIDADNHFNASLIPNYELTIVTSMAALSRLEQFDPKGDFKGPSMFVTTYILLPRDKDKQWLQQQVDAIVEAHAPAEVKADISRVKVRPLSEANNMVWDAFAIPVLESVQLLGLLVLIIATVNYTNLATALSFGRVREVGLRKTLGAQSPHLLAQFLGESLLLVSFAMLIALSCIELVLPVFNATTAKVMTLDYLAILPWLTLITLAVALLGGAYPAFEISRHSPIDSLRNQLHQSPKGSFFSALMISAQFAVSIFIVAMVMVIYSQNQKMYETSKAFDGRQIIALSSIDIPYIKPKWPDLYQQLARLPGVESMTYSSHAPFYQLNWIVKVTPDQQGKKTALDINMVSVDADFMEAYRIELLAGRPLGAEQDNGKFAKNVVINQLTARELGFASDDKALGRTFYHQPDNQDEQAQQYTIVGIMEDLNFLGIFNELKPLAFYVNPAFYHNLSIRVNEHQVPQTLKKIDATWARVIDSYPIQRRSVEEAFYAVFRIFQGLNTVLAAFAAVALSLALFGLFGLTTFMAQRRSKEIALRKIMGAGTGQIVRLLVWQFSMPVVWSLPVALPLAWFASNAYLSFFEERFEFVIPVLILSALVCIFTAWAIVASHAISVARATPIQALRRG